MLIKFPIERKTYSIRLDFCVDSNILELNDTGDLKIKKNPSQMTPLTMKIKN